jgi:plasmid stabilization system protein ParE
VHSRIKAILTLLLQHPEAGVRADDPTIRRMTTTPYPYLIFYEIAENEIIVHAVRHGARDPSGNPGSSR